MSGYAAQLDALHQTCGGLVASPSGRVLASPAQLDAPGRLGLAVGTGIPEYDSEFADGLLALHRDLLTAALAHAIRHLDARHSEGAALLSRPQIQADLAEIAAEIRADAVPATATPMLRWARHQRLTGAGRRLLHLLGASSMLADGPGADLYLAELTGNVYLQRGDDDD